jgi:hypothetical protein
VHADVSNVQLTHLSSPPGLAPAVALAHVAPAATVPSQNSPVSILPLPQTGPTFAGEPLLPPAPSSSLRDSPPHPVMMVHSASSAIRRNGIETMVNGAASAVPASRP